jgi:hypothetical protein
VHRHRQPGHGERRPKTPDRTGQTDARILARRDRISVQPHECAKAGDEQRRGGRKAARYERGNVSHLMDVDADDDRRRDLPPRIAQ